jgi:hypothetical protein
MIDNQEPGVTGRTELERLVIISLKENEIGEACSTYARDEKFIQHLVRIPGRKAPIERPWENDIKVDLKEMRCENIAFTMCFRLSSSGRLL